MAKVSKSNPTVELNINTGSKLLILTPLNDTKIPGTVLLDIVAYRKMPTVVLGAFTENDRIHQIPIGSILYTSTLEVTFNNIPENLEIEVTIA